MYLLVFLFAAAFAAPHHYIQTQEGETNMQAEIENIFILIAIPQKTSLMQELLEDLLQKKNKDNQPNDDHLQRRTYVQITEAFTEKNTPYKVEIGSDKENSVAVEEVVLARQRHIDGNGHKDELKLLGATEQCGPGRERDPVTLGCRNAESNESLQSESNEGEQKLDAEPVPEVVST